MNKLSINMVTYDRFSQYVKSIKSVKPLLKGEEYILNIGVDTKLSKPKYYLKKLITKLILGNSNYTFKWAGNCIGASRDILVNRASLRKYIYFMNLDDDDLIIPEAVKKITPHTDFQPDIVNFDFYPDTIHQYNMLLEEGRWHPKEWFGCKMHENNEISVGQNSLFKVSLYDSLEPEYKYRLPNIDDFLPNTVMYLRSKIIHTYRGLQVEIRARNTHSLSIDMEDDVRLNECTYSLNEIFKELDLHKELNKSELFKVLSNNLANYHARFRGESFKNKILNYKYGYK